MKTTIRNVRQKLGLAAGAFFLLCSAVGFAQASVGDLDSLVGLFSRIALAVREKYVMPVDDGKMVAAGINGMLKELDPFSRYLQGEEFRLFMEETKGEYVGIGIEIERHGDTLRVCAVAQGGPADRAKVKIGDRLVKIDTVSLVGRSPSDCLTLLRGEESTQVSITIWRPLLTKSLDLELVRERITIKAVPYWCVDGNNNGYIRIARFSDGSAQEVDEIVTLLMARNISGLIIDIQNNPGGLLYEAVETAALFLEAGDKVVETRGRDETSYQSYRCREDGIYRTGPLAIIIDDQTASAAEIVAGAIQDHDRGLVIGTTSYGKGLVQQLLRISDEAALKLTTAKYYTPSDRCIQKEIESKLVIRNGAKAENVLHFTDSGRPVFEGGGIIPDIYVEPEETSAFIDEILTYGLVDDFVAERCANLEMSDTFSISDVLVQEFYKYLMIREYEYASPAHSLIARFLAENSDWLKTSRITGQVEILKAALKERSRDEMLSLEPRLREVLWEAFVVLKLGEAKSCQLVRLKTEPVLLRASEILRSPAAYSQFLNSN